MVLVRLSSKLIVAMVVSSCLIFEGKAADASKSCDQFLRDLISKDFEIENIKLKIQPATSLGNGLAIKVFYLEQGTLIEVGMASTLPVRDQEGIVMAVPGYTLSSTTYIDVEEDFQGKGFGALLYLSMARSLFLRGHILMKSYDTSPAADHLWDVFVDRGYAQKVPINKRPGSYEETIFRLEFLQSTRPWKELDVLLLKSKIQK